jgi:RNA polymerase sigma-32 factor
MNLMDNYSAPTNMENGSTQYHVIEVDHHRLHPEYIKLMADNPPLSAADEFQLAVSLKTTQDTTAAQKLIVSNLRLVVFVARNYKYYTGQLMDLVQEGTVGLMKAVRRFDPYKGLRLATYAVPWIKAEIQRFLEKSKKHLEQSDRTYTENTNDHGYASLYLEADGPTDELNASEWTNEQSPEKTLEYKQHAMALERHLSTLDPTLKSIIEKRFYTEPPLTLKAIANDLNISTSRVQQLEQRALEKLKALLG